MNVYITLSVTGPLLVICNLEGSPSPLTLFPSSSVAALQPLISCFFRSQHLLNFFPGHLGTASFACHQGLQQANKENKHVNTNPIWYTMLPNGEPVLMALLVAYCAMASPVNTRPGAVQAVIDAIKAQLKADNISHASTLVNEAEASLWADGVLNDDIVAKLEQEIQVSRMQIQKHLFHDQHCRPYRV